MGQANRFRLASLNNFSGAWGLSAIPACLIPGPGMIKAGNSD